jgi:putative chitinase
MSDEMQRMIRDIHSTLFTEMPSRSIYRGSNNPEWQAVELISNNDGFLHQDEVETQARAGNLGELDRVVRTARGEGLVTEQWAIVRAQRVIADIEREDPDILKRYMIAMQRKTQGALT